VRPVVASDFSAERRAAAETMGADRIVDPALVSPHASWAELGVPGTRGEAMMAAMQGQTVKRAVIFECVGVPGMIDGVITAAPVNSRVVVVGVCMGDDHLRPALANGKEIDLRFVLAYTPLEFRDTLYLLAEGKVDASGVVTGTVGLEGVAPAFDALADPERHAKILIDPASTSVAV